ncbi:hypothetical protein IAQ61_000214 [Plenodomus lingam]|uniref:uncharacterized protein n=1 Tax=Leptosphaeria maculans TaxID=5022 RepID=UPI00332953AB|nr:hypothetical protein IAQ61_000214 [Plenodomus lingam]
MNPHQQNKVDINVRQPLLCQTRNLHGQQPCILTQGRQKMSAEEAKLFRLYGKLPNKKDLLQNKLKVRSQALSHCIPIKHSLTRSKQERKYFDSGDYALSKAGKASDVGVTQVGREHPNPEKIPHIAPPTPTSQQNGSNNIVVQAEKVGSPVKEHTFLHRETSLNRETSASDLEKENMVEQAQEGAAKA